MELRTDDGLVGIVCDQCGSSHDSDFIYYSLDFRHVKVTNNIYPTGIGQSTVIFSLEACQKCLDKIGAVVKTRYAPTRIGINCDLCSNEYRGTFEFYYCTVQRAVVSMSSGLVECAKCHKPAADLEKPCKCGSVDMSRIAAVSIDDSFLHVVSCESCYSGLTENAERIRRVAGEMRKTSGNRTN